LEEEKNMSDQEALKNKNDEGVKQEKKELKILLILSGIGFIIGAIIGISASLESGEIIGIFLGMWFGIGIGGALSFITEIPYHFKSAVREKGFGEGIKSALMGILLWLAIFAVAGPIGLLIRVLRTNSRIKKIRTAVEAFKNTNTYNIALRIRDEFKNKGYDASDEHFDFVDGSARGYMFSSLPGSNFTATIAFTGGKDAFEGFRKNFLATKIKSVGHCYGIENPNIGILVYSDEVTHEIPECIKIAEVAIKSLGFASGINPLIAGK
jgi:hypothetical protein